MKHKLVWFEGMLLRPQHFQQQERYFFHSLNASLAAANPYLWGIRRIDFDPEKLDKGQLALARCEGILPDGTVFSLTEPEDAPEPLQFSAGERNVRVFLGLPDNDCVTGAHLIDDLNAASKASLPGSVEPRFRASPTKIDDANLGYEEKQTVHVARPCFRLFKVAPLPSQDGRLGYRPPTKVVGLPIAHVREVQEERIVLDREFIPPCLEVTEIAAFRERHIPELRTSLTSAAADCADWLQRVTQRGAKEIDAILSLAAINRCSVELRQMDHGPIGHPYNLYRLLLGLYSELSTSRLQTRIPLDNQPYRHDDLKSSLDPLLDQVQELLRIRIVPDVIEIPVKRIEQPEGYYFLAKTSPELKSLVRLRAEFFVVAGVSEQSQTFFMQQCIIADGESLEELLRAGKMGIGLELVRKWPEGVRFAEKCSCFRLVRSPSSKLTPEKQGENDSLWEAIASSKVGIGFHVKRDPPNTFTLWAKRNPEASTGSSEPNQ